MKHLRIDIFLLLGVLALVGFGIVIIYSSSAAFAQGRGLPDSFYLVNHIKKVIIGFIAFLVPALLHFTAPLSLTEVAFLIAVGCGSAVALYVLRSSPEQRQHYWFR